MVVEIRQLQKDDEDAIVDICYTTGDDFMKWLIPTPYMFGLYFCLYYVWYETGNCFVAEDTETSKVIGYILSSLDSTKQYHDFKDKMELKIKEYQERGGKFPLKTRIFSFIKFNHSISKKLVSAYPAHLHIDIFPSYQRQGIGHRLVQALEAHFRKKEVAGYHLEVGAGNKKGVSFYRKYGMNLLSKNLFGLIFGKRMD
ncbi:MAG: GNAT family N-acetyltransferase [Candidatus Hodarchaeota archaeon]